ncbi:MAG TPA: hypothetical protein VMW95_01695, partial [Desulfobacterales bacterium]|nr:hypothetical protein [Desulfobacterales bacterium]
LALVRKAKLQKTMSCETLILFANELMSAQNLIVLIGKTPTTAHGTVEIIMMKFAFVKEYQMDFKRCPQCGQKTFAEGYCKT